MIEKNDIRQMFIKSLKEGVVPATGCTEPIAVAYAAANCMSYLNDQKLITDMHIKVSSNIMKNAMAVIVPGTGRPGLITAASAGIVAGDPNAGLSVISELSNDDLPAIFALADSGKISVDVANVDDDLYVEAIVSDDANTVRVCIAGDHTNIFLIQKNDDIIFSKDRPTAHAISETKQFLQTVELQDIWEFAKNEPLEEIEFMKEASVLNLALSEDGFKNDYGIKLGQSLRKSRFNSSVDDLCNDIVSTASAASDARMGGSQLAAMSNSGSGNQGITATIPVSIVSEYVGANEEDLIRALTLSHLTALYIHSFLPVLSAFCATDSAAMGAATGCVYLLTGDFNEACSAIKNMVGDAAGMVCDGAGCSCAMKVASSTSSMYRAVNLAIQDIEIPSSNGLIHDNIDDTIKGLGTIVSEGFKGTDPVILNVMVNK